MNLQERWKYIQRKLSLSQGGDGAGLASMSDRRGGVSWYRRWPCQDGSRSPCPRAAGGLLASFVRRPQLGATSCLGGPVARPLSLARPSLNLMALRCTQIGVVWSFPGIRCQVSFFGWNRNSDTDSPHCSYQVPTWSELIYLFHCIIVCFSHF